jgi:hypothetical protein
LEQKNFKTDMEALKKEILIDNETFLKDIQSKFNAYYPFLKIEFWELKKTFLKPGMKNNHYSMQVKDVSFIPQPILIDVSEEQTIDEVIKDFKNNSGTNIDVYRKSGNVWNIISLTESWTLKSQNNAGKFISCEMQLDS